jgi:tripartite-type tricarboxylate transporter receptor subunit TctC
MNRRQSTGQAGAHDTHAVIGVRTADNIRRLVLDRRAFLRLTTTGCCSALFASCDQSSHEHGAETFARQTVRILVAFGPGGSYDLHARLVARYLGRYLPGTPDVIVENKPGAGGAVAANYLASVAKPDGRTIGHLVETSAASAVESDLLNRMIFLGSPGPSVPVMVFSQRSGIANIEDWRRAAVPPRIGSSGPRAQSYVVPRIAQAALGLPMQIISGYAGSAEIRMALENGEADAICVSADAFKTVFGSDSGAKVVLRFATAPIPGFDAPDALSLAGDQRARELLDVGVYAVTALARFYALPPNVPAQRVTLLRDAFNRTWTDTSFLAEAQAAGLVIAPVSAAILEQTLRTLATRQDVLRALRSILQSTN